MPMSDAQAVAWIEQAPKVFWPLVALTLALLFRAPVEAAINSIIDGRSATVSFGIVKLEFNKNDIPTPTEPVKRVLAEITPDMIEFTMARVGGHNTIDQCHWESEDEFREGSISVSLAKLRLITFEPQPWHDDKGVCDRGSKTRFTPLYDSVRNYLIDVLKSLRFQKT